LNFLKGTDSTDFLASLDRDSSGNVTASAITVDSFSLETTAGTAVDSSLGAGASGVNGNQNSAAQLVANGNDFALDIDQNYDPSAGGDVWEVRIDGRKFTYTAQVGDDLNDVGTGLNNLLTDAGYTTTLTAGTAGSADVQLDITNDTGGTVAYEVNVTDGTGGGLANLNTLDVSTSAGAADALVKIEGLIQESVDASAEFGSAQKRIEIQNEFVSNLTDSLKTGIGALTDADLEAASARLQSLQVQQQLGIQALSIANSSPNAILGLFQ
ncbi:flagellin, partial [Hyphococcus luteus]|uniref:flagellin n=1 Tax=Hyphococcus luteus TaxID=2058213 RepID=UPI0013FE4E74